MEKETRTMKVASLKFSNTERPSFYGVTIDGQGNILYYNKKGELHRLDGPAIERWDGSKEWYVDGKPHRLDGPAVERPDGTKIWYVDGKPHRLDGPAIEMANGLKFWYVDGRLISASEEDFERWKKEHGL